MGMWVWVNPKHKSQGFERQGEVALAAAVCLDGL